MLVALTGASGFIGSYTARTLSGLGHSVRAMVRESSRRDHIQAFVSEWTVGVQDDPGVIDRLTDGVDAVIHNSVDWGSAGDPIRNAQSNLLGSIRLLESARKAGAKQFVFVSSVAAYHEILQDRPLDENHPTWPSGLYGAYKAAVEPFLKAYHHGHRMNTSAWRPAAVYGVDPNLRRSQWYELIDSARKGETIDTPRGGKITHVQDVADALALAIGDDTVSGEFYTLVDRYMYWQQPAMYAKELSGSSATIVDRGGAGPKNSFDCSKAIAFLDRHHNSLALRRGLDGVKHYVGELLPLMK